MAKYRIYHKDNTVLKDSNGKEIAVHSIEYNGTWMGECFVTVTFENEAPISFSIGDYIEYRGERFEINYDPGKIKCASKDSYGGAFKYDSVKFNALSDELVRCDMLDLVLYDNQLHYTALPQFSFYVESLDDLLDRIQANLDELYGKASWKLYSRNKERSVQRGGLESEWNSIYGDGTADNVIDSTSISISDQTCWDALSLVSSKFDINFIIRNRNVYVGTAGLPTGNIFKYGKGNGLYEIEQNSESDQMVITKLRAYGSNRNLPNSYYATLDAVPYAIADGFSESEGEGGYQLAIKIDKTKYEGAFTNVNYEAKEGFKECFVGCEIGSLAFTASVYMVKTTAGMSDNTLVITDKATAQEVKPLIGDNTRITFTSGANAHGFNGNRLDYSSSLPNNMACDRLMLPGFPKQSLREWWDSQSEAKKAWLNPGGKTHIFSDEVHRPYVTSLKVDKIGVRPASAFFDQDDKVNGIVEIYPTIEEMEVGGVRIDEIDTGTSVEDNGVFADVDSSTIPNAVIYLKKEINFDINELKDSDFSISMKDGMCAGRDFSIASCRKEEDGRWRLQIERKPDETLGLYFPYNDFQIKKGDHFVLTGIELPDAYVEAASEKLLKYCIAYLDRNDYTRYVYQPKVDEIFMARQHDKAMTDASGLTKSLYLTLKEGDIMLFKDEDLGIDGEVTIDQLTIKEADGKIPTYEITLRDEKEVSTIQKIQNQISSITSGNGGYFSGGTGGNGLSTSQIKSLIKSVGSDYFLSKLAPDTAAGIITFLQGLKSLGEIFSEGKITAKGGAEFGEFVKSALWDGRGGCIDKDGNAWLRNLTLSESLTVPKLSYNMVEICPGIKWQSAGGGTIREVEIETDADGNPTANGTITLDLQDGEIGQIAAGDLCMAVFHSLWDTEMNATEDSDSGTGVMTRAGFYTCYFRITDILEGEHNSKARYVLRNDEDWPHAYHPSPQMTFVAFGNPEREDRQTSCYQTTTYTRYLRKVTTWKFQAYNVAMQLGDLSNLTVFGYALQGYSAFLNNAYVTGHIENIRDTRPYVTIRGLEDSHVETGGSRTVTMLLTRDNVNYKDAEWEITRESGLPSSDIEWNDAHKSVASPMTLTSADLGEGAYLQAVMFTFTGRKTITDGSTGNPVSFEASSAAVLTLLSREQLWIDFECEKGRTFSVLYNNVDLKVTARLMYGDSDITDDILLRSSTTMKWRRDSGVPSADLAWTAVTDGNGNTIHIVDKPDARHDCGSQWATTLSVTFIFECTVIFGAEIVPLSREVTIG